MCILNSSNGGHEIAHSQTDLQISMLGDELLDLKTRCFLKLTKMDTSAAAATSTPIATTTTLPRTWSKSLLHWTPQVVHCNSAHSSATCPWCCPSDCCPSSDSALEMQLLHTLSLLGEVLISSYLSLYLIVWQLELLKILRF